VIIGCRNSECSIKSSGKIRRWIASLDILGIGDAVREAMIERFALEDAADLYLLRDRAAELADLVINTEKDLTLGEKRTTAMLDAIDVTRTLTLGRFLGSLGIDHLGKRRVELMINAAGGDLDTLDDWRSGRLREPALAEKAGVPNVSGQIQDAIDKMSQVMDKLLANGVTVLPPVGDIPASDGMPLKTVCISGKLPSGKKKTDYAEPLNAAGYGLVDDVTKGLDYLVLADPNSSSSKAEKARKLGIEVISEERLEQMVSAAAPAMTVSSPTPTTIKSATNPEEPKMTTKAPAAPAEGNFQRYEYVDDKSSKFWEVRIDGNNVEVRYGKIGTSGQSLTKDFDDGTAARKHADKLTAEKLKGGYKPVNTSVGIASKKEATQKANTPAKTATETKAAAPVKIAPQAPSAEKSVCISGKLPSGKKKGDFAESLAAVGYQLVEDVRPGLTYLVLADPASASAKAEKAKKLGIQVISEDELMALVAGS
jgi:NAD-dependent DNA ligase